jgi:hypothetical protein
MAEIYPLPMRFPTKDGRHVDVSVDRQAWRFCTSEDDARYRSLPVGERMELRIAFEAQVQLAKDTPTKGEH